MGGQVGVDSVVGEGSDFWFTLELPLDPERATPVKVEGLAGKRVLIVDDVELARRHLVERVSRWGMAADSASGGTEAMDRMRTARAAGHPYDVVLVDLFMPDMDGRQLGDAIRADHSFDATQIMVLTGRPGRGDGAFFQSAGFDGYLVKPVRDSVLARALAFALETPREKRSGIITRHSLDEGGAIPPPSTPELARFDGLRVLLAEDNSTNRKIGVRMLEKLGCRVEVAANGVEAVAMAKDFPYDLILMDMQMPEMDGLEATVRIRAMGGALAVLPIVALTANVMESDRNACAQAGMNGFVSKPVKRADLLTALQRWGPDRLEVAA
jgi:CheY-like chemotaxis protein